MAVTYTPIATTTVGSTVTSVIFSSIPSTYTDLVLVSYIIPSDTSAPSVLQYFNGDTAQNYSENYIYGNGTDTLAAAGRRNNTYRGFISERGLSATTTTPTTIVTHINNYKNTSIHKTIWSRGATPDKAVELTVSCWRSTAVINSMEIFVLAGGFATNSNFTLYGILAA